MRVGTMIVVCAEGITGRRGRCFDDLLGLPREVTVAWSSAVLCLVEDERILESAAIKMRADIL